MMVPHSRNDVAQARKKADEFCTSDRMLLHDLPFLGSKTTFLRKNRPKAFIDLAHIVQERSNSYALNFSGSKAD